jgi:CRISPR system Cascade subunit CasA
MHESEPLSFDLIHEPWIPAHELDGTTNELGIRALLERAHELAGLSGDIPTQTFALTRLLLAVLYGALAGPTDAEEWRALWRAKRLPAERIGSYLNRHRDRFDLFHPSTPFMQVGGLRTAKGDTSELSKLVADVPNGVPFFTTRQGGNFTLSYAEAARWLVHCHAFDPSGIKSGAVGDPRVKNGKGYPIGVAWSGLLGGVLLEGVTLKETLLLNLVARDFVADVQEPQADLPVWEREPLTAAEEQPDGRRPTGPVDLYTWQGRRIRLFASSGRVTSVLVANGERLTPQNRHTVEPHTAWRRSEAQEKKLGRPLVYMPRTHDPDRAIWRGLQSLLPETSPARQAATGAAALAPGIVEWLGFLSLEGWIDPDQPDRQVRLRAVGMVYGSQSSVVEDLVHDTLAMRATLARHGATSLAQIAVAAVQAAESAVRAVGNLAGDLAAAAGDGGGGPRSRWLERIYAELDQPFRAWLLHLRSDSDPTDVQIDWHRQVAGLVRAAARELLRDIPPACWEGRVVRGHVLTAAHAEARFWRDLRQALPYAFPSYAATTSQ